MIQYMSPLWQIKLYFNPGETPELAKNVDDTDYDKS